MTAILLFWALNKTLLNLLKQSQSPLGFGQIHLILGLGLKGLKEDNLGTCVVKYILLLSSARPTKEPACRLSEKRSKRWICDSFFFFFLVVLFLWSLCSPQPASHRNRDTFSVPTTSCLEGLGGGVTGGGSKVIEGGRDAQHSCWDGMPGCRWRSFSETLARTLVCRENWVTVKDRAKTTFPLLCGCLRSRRWL